MKAGLQWKLQDAEWKRLHVKAAEAAAVDVETPGTFDLFILSHVHFALRNDLPRRSTLIFLSGILSSFLTPSVEIYGHLYRRNVTNCTVHLLQPHDRRKICYPT